MSTLDDLHKTMREWRTARKGGGSRGQALYDLNRWLGEERKKLSAEYERRRSDIEAIPDTVDAGFPDEALDLVAKAHREGASRSAIRVALGKQSLSDADEVIALARERFQGKVQSGQEGAYALSPTGEVHPGKGWPFYNVTLHATGETHKGLHLITPEGFSLKRAHLKIHPAPPGSQEILEAVWASGAAEEMFQRGKG